MNAITNYYPVLATADVPAAANFFQEHFGFTLAYESDWYVHLVNAEHPSVALALVAKDHETIPLPGRVPAAGLLINFEVDDVDAEYARLSQAGIEMLQPLRDEPWGQRHFIVQGPDGVLIDVIKPIPPSAEYAEGYVGTVS